jgi:hypothetical protein
MPLHFLVRRRVYNCCPSTRFCSASRTLSRFFLPSEPGGLPRLFGGMPVAAFSGMTLILLVTPAAETVVTPCRVGRLLLGSTVVDSILLRGALVVGFGWITSTGPSRLTLFTFGLDLATDFARGLITESVWSNVARFAGVRRESPATVVARDSTLLDRSLALEDGALVDRARVLAEASERGARPRGKLSGGVGRGALVGIIGRMPVGVSGMGIGAGRTEGGAAFGGGRVGGFAIPEFQGATLGFSAFRDLSYESNSRCCCLMMASGLIVGAGRGTGTGIAIAPAPGGGGGGPGG